MNKKILLGILGIILLLGLLTTTQSNVDETITQFLGLGIEETATNNAVIELTATPMQEAIRILEESITQTPTSATTCSNGTCVSTITDTPIQYHNGTDWLPINTTILPEENIISGRDYNYAASRGIYQAYFRDRSSDTNTRPVAIQKEGYVFTLAPQDFITFEPHKGTKNGRLGNRQISDIIISDNKATYPEQYGQIGDSAGLANLTYHITSTQLKEELVIWNKTYLQNRFSDQVDQADYNRTNLVFPTIIRAYKDEDLDNNTLGIIYGNDRTNFKDFGSSANDEQTLSQKIEFTDENNNTIYTIPELYAYDSDGNTILLNKTLSMTSFGNLRIDILVPWTWLNNTNTTYPVYIDPPVILNYTTTDVWEAPVSVSSVQVELWGAGGSGGGGNNANADGGGGGAGGQYVIDTSIPVVAGNNYTITIGAGGTGVGKGVNGNPGGDTWFNSTTTVIAKGGAGGQHIDAGGAGGVGSTTGGIGDTVYRGGSGGDGSGTNSGGGGGGAGSTGNGGNGTADTQGTGTANFGGDGGAGTTANSGPGIAGSVYGGGAGGSTKNGIGGDGAPGRIVLTYALNSAPTITVALSGNATVDGGETINYTITATDIEGDSHAITVCDAAGISNGYPGSCSTGNELCNATGFTNGTTSTCSYTTTKANVGTLTAYGYVCDNGGPGCSGPNSTSTTVNDVYEPIITAVLNSSITNESALITWSTDESANSSVIYGTTLAMIDGSNESASTGTSHSLMIYGLTNETLYYFNVTSCDSVPNCNTSGPYNFTTAKTPSKPIVSGVQLSVNPGRNASLVNFSATISDDDGVDYSELRISYPDDSSWIDTPMIDAGSNVWWATFTSRFDPAGNYSLIVFANDSLNNINDSEGIDFIPYLSLNESASISIDGSFSDWENKVNLSDPSVCEGAGPAPETCGNGGCGVGEDQCNCPQDCGSIPGLDVDISSYSIANNDTYLFARMSLDFTPSVGVAGHYYRAFIGVNSSSGGSSSLQGDSIPFNYDYWVELRGTCNLYAYCENQGGACSSDGECGGCASTCDTVLSKCASTPTACSFSTSGKKIEISVPLSDMGLSFNDPINVSWQTVDSSDTDAAPDANSFVEFTVLEDLFPPEIINVLNSSITNVSVLITWTTDEPANSSVVYGSTIGMIDGSNESASTGTSHSLMIYGLTNETLYYYNVSSCDNGGYCSTSGPYNFTTLNNSDITDPVINSVINYSISSNSVLINWTTNEIANSSVIYGTTLAMIDGNNESAGLVTAHNIGLFGLTNGTLYYYNVSSCDGSGNCNTSGPYNFTTGNYGRLLVTIYSPTERGIVNEGDIIMLNASAECIGNVGDVCGTISGIVRYNASGDYADTTISETIGTLPVYIQPDDRSGLSVDWTVTDTYGYTAYDLEVDANSVYVVGTNASTGGAYYIVRMNRTTGAQIWNATDVYGTNARGVAVDAEGVYVAGSTSGNDWYTIKLNITDGTHIWNRTDTYGYNATGASVDADGVYVVGTNHSNGSYYIIKYNVTDGTELWNKTVVEGVAAQDTVVDSSGVYVTGYNTTNTYLVKLNLATGAVIAESTWWQVGVTSYAIALNPAGNMIYVVGRKDGTFNYDMVSYNTALSGSQDRSHGYGSGEGKGVAVTSYAQYGAGGTGLVYRYIGTNFTYETIQSSGLNPEALASDDDSSIYVAGSSGSNWVTRKLVGSGTNAQTCAGVSAGSACNLSWDLPVSAGSGEVKVDALFNSTSYPSNIDAENSLDRTICIGSCVAADNPPAITSVLNHTFTNHSIIINWSTDESSNSSVIYGTTTDLLDGYNGSSSLTTSHSIGLFGLSNFTQYYYNVTSCDSGGLCNTTGPYTFTTNQTSTAPLVSNVQADVNPGINGSVVNVSATIDDNDGVSFAEMRISFPNGSSWSNTSMSDAGSNVWWATFTSRFYPAGNYSIVIFANDSLNNINADEGMQFVPYLDYNKTTSISIDGSFGDWNVVSNITDITSDSVHNNDSDVYTFSIANRNDNLYSRMGLLGRINNSLRYRFYISTNSSTGKTVSNEGDQLPFPADYFLEKLSSTCKKYKLSGTLSCGSDGDCYSGGCGGGLCSYASLDGTCTFENNSDELELSVSLNSMNVDPGEKINVSWETITSSVRSDTAPDSQSFIEFTTQSSPISISNELNSSIGFTSVTISWNTDLSSNSSVIYGTTTDLIDGSNESASLVLTHSLDLDGLSNNTLYYYNLTSCGGGYCNTSGPYSFTTLNYGYLVVTISNPSGDVSRTSGDTVYINATAECAGGANALCGDVEMTLRINDTTPTPDTGISRIPVTDFFVDYTNKYDLDWSVNEGAGASYDMCSNETAVFVSGNNASGRSQVIAYNIGDGSHLWNFSNSSMMTIRGVTCDSGFLYLGSQSVGSDYFVIKMNDTTRQNIWETNFSQGNFIYDVVTDDTSGLYIGGNNDSSKFHVVKLNSTTGAHVWNVSDSYGGTIRDIAYDDGRVFVIGYSGITFYLVAYNASTGVELWNYTKAYLTYGRGNDASKGAVYVGGTAGTDYYLAKFNASTGVEIWNFTRSIPGYTTPVSAVNEYKGVVFSMGSYAHAAVGFLFIAVNASDGSYMWNYSLAGSYFPYGADIDSQNGLYATFNGYTVRLLPTNTVNQTIDGGENYSFVWHVNVSALEGEARYVDVIANSTSYAGISVNDSVDRKITMGAAEADVTAPSITGLSPGDEVGDTDTTVNISYSASDATGLADCKLYWDGGLNVTDASAAGNFSVTGLSAGSYDWFVSCTDSSANSNQANSTSRTIVVVPASTFQDVYNLSGANATNVSGFWVNESVGLVNWTDSINLSGVDLDASVVIGSGWAYVNSGVSPRLNAAAQITLRGLPYKKQPVVLVDGVACGGCVINSYSAGTLVFSVAGFSNYSASANSQLNISDDTDLVTKYTSELIMFSANYSNLTDNTVVAGAGVFCSFTENSGGGWSALVNMSYNSTNELYQYNRSFSSAGSFTYNVTCNGSSLNYETIGNLTDIFTVSAVIKHWNGSFDSTGQTPGGWNLSTNAYADWFYPVELLFERNFTLNAAAGNQAPVVAEVFAPVPVTPTSNGTVVFYVNFSVTDTDGASTIDNSTARVSINRSGVSRDNISCSAGTLNATSLLYNCTVGLLYYDLPGVWSINVSVNDSGGLSAVNASQEFTVNELLSVAGSPGVLGFGSLSPGASSGMSNDPLILSNLGNVNLTSVNVTGYELRNGVYTIGAGNFSVNTVDSAGTSLVNASMVSVAGSYVDLHSDSSALNESLWFWVSVPTVAPVSYSSVSDWVVSAGR